MIRKFWPNLEILEAFVIDLQVSFLGDFASWSIQFFKSWSRILTKPRSCSLTKSHIYNPIPLEVHVIS